METMPTVASAGKRPVPPLSAPRFPTAVPPQNALPLTADDVVYTINDIIHDKQVAIPAYYTSFAGAEKIDDFHVRLKLTGVSPAVMEYLAMVTPIWPKTYREKIGAHPYAHSPIGPRPSNTTTAAVP